MSRDADAAWIDNVNKNNADKTLKM